MSAFIENDNPNEMSSASQKKMIQQYLEEGETITQLEALKLFRCFRLASRMNDLKKENVPFASVMVKTKTDKSVKAYYLPEAFALRHNRENDDELAGFVKTHTELKLSTM